MTQNGPQATDATKDALPGAAATPVPSSDELRVSPTITLALSAQKNSDPSLKEIAAVTSATYAPAPEQQNTPATKRCCNIL